MTPKQKQETRANLVAIIKAAIPEGTHTIAANAGLTTRCIADTLRHGVIDVVDFTALCRALDLDATDVLAQACDYDPLPLNEFPDDEPVPYQLTAKGRAACAHHSASFKESSSAPSANSAVNSTEAQA